MNITGHCLFQGICLTQIRDHLWSESRHFDALAVMDGAVFGSVWNNGNGGHHELTPRKETTEAVIQDFKRRMEQAFSSYVPCGKDVFDYGIDSLLDFAGWAAYVRSCKRFLGTGKCFRMVTRRTGGQLPRYKFHTWPRVITTADFTDEADKLGFVWDSPRVEGFEELCLDVNIFAPTPVQSEFAFVK
jgi:hypothetical protein